MRELETLFIVLAVVTGGIIFAYWKMARKARPKKSKGWTEPKVK